jgi:hypothetical protein
MTEIETTIVKLNQGDKFYFGKTKRFIYQVHKIYIDGIAARILNGRHPNSIRYYGNKVYVTKIKT